ncbi:hypothetical protein Tco_1258632 [Tanacetum coccineum]
MSTMAENVIAGGANNRPRSKSVRITSGRVGLPPDVYTLVNHHTNEKKIWDRLFIDINMIRMTMQKLKVNTKFVKNLQPEWRKFVTDVKLAKDMHESSFDQLYAYLRQHEVHANEVRMMRKRFPNPLALVA